MSGCGTADFGSRSPTPVLAAPLAPISGYCERALAIGNERLFKYWVGLNATLLVRLQVIAFQNRYDLLDDEIRWLKRAGHLRVTRHELIVDTSRMMPIYGWFQITLISLVFGIEKAVFNTSALQLERDRASAPQASIGSLVMEDLAIFAAPR